MAFEDIRIPGGAYVVVENDAGLEDGTVTGVLTDVPAGAFVFYAGGTVKSDFSANVSLSSASSSVDGAMTVRTQSPTGGVGGSAIMAYRANSAGGTQTITLTLSSASGNRISGVFGYILGAAIASALDGGSPVDEYESNATDTTLSSGATTTLSQTDCLCIGVGAGSFGNPTETAGWTTLLRRANGSPNIGTYVAYKKVTATTAVSFDITHPSSTAWRSAMLIVIKAATASAYNYEFPFALSADGVTYELNDTHTGLTVHVYRNIDPDDGASEIYTGQAGAADGVLVIEGAPSGALLTDDVKCTVEGANIASVGYVAGSVVAA